jgi:hypothetical protein
MSKRYQEVISDFFQEETGSNPTEFLEVCFWGIQFGEDVHDDILLVVEQVLEEDRINMEGSARGSHRK